MECREKGTLPGSEVVFPIYPGDVMDNYYYVTTAGRFICESDYKIDRDDYPSPLLMCVTNGRLGVYWNKRNYSAEAGDIVLIDCQSHHRYYADPEADFMFFHFSGVNSPELAETIIKQNDGPIFSQSQNIEEQEIKDRVSAYFKK